MPIKNDDNLTRTVLEAYRDCPSPRLAQILASLLTHLHAFVRDVQLTEEELGFAFDFLNRVGQASNDAHNEAALLSDALGVSTLACLLNNGMGGPTEPATALLGPFWRLNAPELENGASIVHCPTDGTPMSVEGRVCDVQGNPIPGARVDVWQASPIGLYENQDPDQTDMNLRGVFTCDAQGRFHFSSVRPAGYPVPMHGPTGDLLRAFDRQPFRPAHLHVLIYKPGFKTLVAQVFPGDDAHLEDDPVFGVTEALTGDYHDQDGVCTLSHVFVLREGEARLPTPPIK